MTGQRTRRIRTAWMRGIVWTAAVFLMSVAVHAQDKIETFRLETMDRSRTYGPFELGSGRNVFIGGKAFTVRVAAGKKIEFVSPDADQVFGPFDFVAGRIVELGKDHYTLIDIRKIPAPKGKTPPVQPVNPSAPAQKVKPTKPVEPSSQQASPVKGRPIPVEHREGQGSIGAQLGLVDITLYDAEVGDTLSKSDTTIERQSLSIFLDRGPIKLQAGLTFNGEWSETASEPGLGFEDAELVDGQGWWLSARYAHDLYRDNEWRVNAYAEVSYRSEDYSLEYGQWVNTQLYLPGTNGAGGIESVVEFRDSESDVTLSEFGLRLGAGIAYDSARWWCFGGLDVVALEETDVDGGISSGEERHNVELDRSLPVNATGGVGIKAGDYRFFIEGRAGGDLQVSLGAAYTLW